MPLETIRSALATIDSDPDSASAWQVLEEAIVQEDNRAAITKLFAAARQEHSRRREWAAVAQLLELETRGQGVSAEIVEPLRQLAKVERDSLLDEGRASLFVSRILEILPDDFDALQAVEEARAKAQNWRSLKATYLAEADKAPDDVYRSSMLMRAAEVELRFAPSAERDSRALVERLEKALSLCAANERAAELLELLHRRAGDFAALLPVLEVTMRSGDSRASCVAAGTRAARVSRYRLHDPARAAGYYRHVLSLLPSNAEALGFLSDYYVQEQRWDELVQMYEASIGGSDVSVRERGPDIHRIAVLLWKTRGDSPAARQWFQRLSKIEPAHPDVLEYFRELHAGQEGAAQLISVLSAAQRVLPSGQRKQAITAEIARLAVGHQDPLKAIEQYKNLLRQDPANEKALAELKVLYRQVSQFHPLVDLLRQELERLAPGDAPGRAAVLREVAELYRGELANDTALVSVLNQVIAFDPQDVAVARELVALYEKLGRWRDLLTSQERLAALTTDAEEKAELLRSAGRRWLDQFSNVQNATQAFEGLLEAKPGDAEARAQLADLYRKRRAWPALFRLYERDLETKQGPERRDLLREMGVLAAERLGLPDQATRIYRELLELDPDDVESLGALERQAERSRDWGALAEALERRVTLEPSAPQRIALLQKLGQVYAEQLQDSGAAERTFLRVLEISPRHARALRILREGYLASGNFTALEALYDRLGDAEGLAEVLSNAADRAPDPAQRVDLSYRAAAVYRDRLGQPARALRSYERVLAADPSDTRAARELIPIYEAEQKWARLPPLYELCLASATTRAEKADHLEKLINLTGARVVDRARSLSYARAAFELSPEQPEALERFEHAARAAADFGPFAESLRGQLTRWDAAQSDAADVPASAEIRRAVRLKLAQACDEHLSATDEAVALLMQVVAEEQSDSEASGLLERILRRDHRLEDLRQLLERRLQRTSEGERRVSMLSEWAALEQSEFGAPDRAAELYRRILEVQPGRLSAVRALPKLLLSLDQSEAAAQALEHQLAYVEDAERSDLEVQLSELYCDKLGQPERALDVLTHTLRRSSQEGRALGVTRRLLEVDATRRPAALLLAETYARAGDGRREAEALEVALGAESSVEERRALLTRLAAVYEVKRNSLGAAFEVAVRAVRELPADLQLWQEAQRLAGAAGRVTELGDVMREALRGELPRDVELELCDRAAHLHEEVLGDALGAAPYLERMLEREPQNQDAFLRLKQILTNAERWIELEALYAKATQSIEDAPTRVELLAEVALVCEEIIEDDDKAIAYYEQVLALEPSHELSLAALDRLYVRTRAFQKLAHLLERRATSQSGADLVDTEKRLAGLYLRELHEPARAVDRVERVLEELPGDYEARDLAESLLEIGSYRVRAARMLEPVYEAKDEVRQLVMVLQVLWEDEQAREGEASPGARELLRRVAILRDERLHDDREAFEALCRYLPLEPLDEDARSRLETIGGRLTEHQRVATVLETAADNTTDPRGLGELLMRAATVCRDRLGDGDRAERLYRRILVAKDAEPALALPAAQALAQLYESSHQYALLADTLELQLGLEQDGAARAELLSRIGELAEQRLSKPDVAIDAFCRRLEELPGDLKALVALERLYETTRAHRNLVGVLEQRLELCDSADERQALLRRQARVLAEELSDVPGAIQVWGQVRSEFGDQDDVLLALEDLNRRAERWEELEENYQAHLENMHDAPRRLKMLTTLGDLRAEALGQPSRALEPYREALALDGTYAPVRLALERLLEAEDRACRREAAEVLEPVFERDLDHQRQLKVLDLQIDGADDPVKRLALLDKATRITENELDNPQRTLMYVSRALREGAGHVDLKPWLERLEVVSAKTRRRGEQVDLLKQVVVDIFEGDLQFAVTLRIAELARDELGDRAAAREYFEKALEIQIDAREPMMALERIYEAEGDTSSLLAILERRADVAVSDQERQGLVLRSAELLCAPGADRDRAIELYEKALSLGPSDVALEALERLYRDAERFDDLAELYRRQLEVTHGSVALAVRVKLARVAARQLGDYPRAFDQIEAALTLEPRSKGAIAELEHIMDAGPEGEYPSRAAALLEPIYLALGDFDRVIATLERRLQFSDVPETRRELLTRLAKLHEEQKEDYRAALAVNARLLEEDISSEETTAELERLARVADAAPDLARIYARCLESRTVDDAATARLAQRAAQLFAQHGPLEQSLALYRRALHFDPTSEPVFSELEALLAKHGLAEDRAQLLTQALDHRFEDGDRLALLERRALIERQELGQSDRAIASYLQALEIDPLHAPSLDALSEIYRERGRFADLAALYLRRAEGAEQAEEAANYRLLLSQVLSQELSDPEGAVDQLDEIVRHLPAHERAIEALEGLRRDGVLRERVVGILLPLYEAADDWRKIIKLNEDRFSFATDALEKVAVLRETARLWEERGSDLEKARRGLALAFELDPSDVEVRQEYERLVEATAGWDELAGVYQARLKAGDVPEKQELLATLGRVHDQHRNDPRRALWAYSKLIEVDETNLAALEKLEQLSTMLSDWDTLVRTLRIKTELVPDAEERASLWRRVGETRRDMLEQPELAIQAYERALELDPQSTFTLDCLIELYEQRGDASRLIDLYQRRVELSVEEDGDLRFKLLEAAGDLYENELSDGLNAIDMYNQALGNRPADPAVLAKVNRLYEREAMWPELLDNLRFAEGVAESIGERVVIRRRIGEVLSEHLGDHEAALETYQLVLSEVPGDNLSIGAVQAIGSERPELRSQCAGVLIPALEREGRHRDLVAALQMRLGAESVPEERAETLLEMARVLEGPLAASGEALEALLACLAETPESDELHGRIERLSRAQGSFDRYAAALSERAQSTFDPEVACKLYTKLGAVRQQELKDLAGAVSAYEAAVHQAGDEPELLASLDVLYEKRGDFSALSEILERRALVTPSLPEQAELYHRLALLQRDHLGDRSRCLMSLRRALECAPGHEASVAVLEQLMEEPELVDEVLEVLEGVYRNQGLATRVADLYRRRLATASEGRDQVEASYALSKVIEEEVGDLDGAQQVLCDALENNPFETDLVAELERLSVRNGRFDVAQAALDKALQKVALAEPATALELATTLARWREERLGDGVGAEQALLLALEGAPDNDELLAQLERLQSGPGRETALVQTLRRRGRLAMDPSGRQEFYERAVSLALGSGSEALAQELLRELLTEDDANDWALAELYERRRASGDATEALALIERRVALAAGDDARALRFEAAELAMGHLGNARKAADFLLAALEEDPRDADAVAALQRIYLDSNRLADLRRLLERQIELTDDGAERIALRLELARLCLDRLHDADGSIEQLNLVLDDDPGNSDAVSLLGALYEKGGRDEDLAQLLERQVDAAALRSDSPGMVRLLERLGGVFESRLRDPERAVDAYRRALDLEPGSVGLSRSLARLLTEAGRVEEAAEVQLQLLEASEGSAEAELVALELVRLYSALEQRDRAIEILETLRSRAPLGASLASKLVELYEQAERFEDLAELHTALAGSASTDSDRVLHWSRAADLFEGRLGAPEQAAELLKKAAAVTPQDRALLLRLCDLFEAADRQRDVVDTLQKVVESYGGRRSRELGDIHQRLARAYRKEGDLVRALQELDSAFRIEPGNVGVLKDLGELSLELGEVKKAQQMYRALLLQRLDSGSPITKAQVFCALGRVHQELGEADKAKKMVERALQTDPGLREAQQLLSALS